MASPITIQQKAPDGKELVTSKFAAILEPYLQPTASVSAAEAAQAASKLAPTSEDGLEDFLWTFWNDFIHTSQQIPYDSPAQDKLVQVVRELTLLPDAGLKVWDARLWTNLPVFGADLRENLNGPETSQDEKENKRVLDGWVNFNAFIARLNTTGACYFLAQPIWLLRSALEEDQSKLQPALRDANVMTAAQIVEYNGTMMLEQLVGAKPLDAQQQQMYKGGSLFEGPSGYSDERWSFWVQRFQEESGKVGSEVVKKAALRAASLMQIWYDSRKSQ